MDMTRRGFLGFIGSIPFLAKAAELKGLATAEEIAEATSEPSPITPTGNTNLWINGRKIDSVMSLSVPCREAEISVSDLNENPSFGNAVDNIQANFFVEDYRLFVLCRDAMHDMDEVLVAVEFDGEVYQAPALFTEIQVTFDVDMGLSVQIDARFCEPPTQIA